MPSSVEIKMAVAAVIEHAPTLREAGVLRFVLGELAVDLAPHKPTHEDVPADTPTSTERKPKSIWHDPELYGLPEDAQPPGLRKDKP